MHIYLLHANKYAVIFLETYTHFNKTKYLTHSNGCIIILKYNFYAKNRYLPSTKIPQPARIILHIKISHIYPSFSVPCFISYFHNL